MGSYHTEVPSHCVAAFISSAAEAKPPRFDSAGAPALHTLLLVLIEGAWWGRKGYELDRQTCAGYTAIYWTIL